MPAMTTPVTFLLALLAGWVNRQQLAVIEHLQEENRILREKLGPKAPWNSLDQYTKGAL